MYWFSLKDIPGCISLFIYMMGNTYPFPLVINNLRSFTIIKKHGFFNLALNNLK